MTRRTPEDEEEWINECKRLEYDPDDDAEELTVDEKIRTAWRLMTYVADYLNEICPKNVHGFTRTDCVPSLKFEVHNLGIRAIVFPVIIPEEPRVAAMTMTASATNIDALLNGVLSGLERQVAEIRNRQDERRKKEEEENARNAT